MAEFAARKIEQGHPFGPGELNAISHTHAEVVASLELALAVFMSGDQKTAGQLLERKKLIWGLESQELNVTSNAYVKPTHKARKPMISICAFCGI
jgi:Na+/phosphate symporter